MRKLWQDLLLPPGNDYLVWELFHENSKLGRHHDGPSHQEIVQTMSELHECLPLVGYPVIELPVASAPLPLALDQALTLRRSSHDMTSGRLTFIQLSTILHYGYGVTQHDTVKNGLRQLRSAPSAGALYPLEIFFHNSQAEGLEAGLYHYNPVEGHARLIAAGDATASIAEALVQPEIARGASVIFFLTAVFERSVFKYGNRGYRFALLEAGHVAQNINLVAGALGLECLNIGGYFDRQIDDFLDIDGITHSTVYLIAIGKREQSLNTSTPT
jgi:SagB-type dehydrogenase family enzyme